MTLLKLSISGGILILLIIVLRFCVMNKLPKKVFMLLWDIVLLRLLVPFYFPVSYHFVPKGREMAESKVYSGKFVMQGKVKSVLLADAPLSKGGNIDWKAVVWFVGMIILLLYFGSRYVKECRSMRMALPVSREADENLRWLVSIPKRVKILVSDRIFTPVTYGVVMPEIILPKFLKLEDNTELKYILTHELVHMKRADNLRKIIMLIAVSIHWFNPFVWVMYVFFNRDIELSCDERVISLLGWEKRKEYAMVLTNLAEKQYHWSLFSNGFGSNAIQERIVAIMKCKKVTVTGIICSVFFVGMAITAFAKNESDSKASYHSVSQNKKDTKVVRTDDSRNAMEIAGVNGEDNDEPLIGDSEQFLEYEKYGLSYDSANNHLVYSGNIVGYFHDEKSKGVYTHITDDMGTIGIVAVRDSDYKLKGLKIVAIPEDSSAVEMNGDGEPLKDSTASEIDEDNSSALKKYKSYGITYHSSKDIWLYKGQQIAGLIDKGDVYIDGRDVSNSVYLQIRNGAVKVITEKQFDTLVD